MSAQSVRGGTAVALAAASAIACFVVARASEVFVNDASQLAAIWPVSGLLLGALLIARERWLPMLAAAAAGLFAAYAALGASPGVAAALAAGDLIAATFGVGAIELIGGRRWRPATLRGTAALLVGGAGLGVAAGALASATALAFEGADWTRSFGELTAARGLGVIALTPVVLAVADREARPFAAIESPSRLERALVLGGTVVLGLLLFTREGGVFDQPAIVVPLLAVAAIRLGWSDTGLVVAILCGFASLGIATGESALVDDPSSRAEVLAAQVVLALFAATALLAAALTAERSRAVERLRREREDLGEAQRIARVGSWTVDPETGDVDWTEQQFRNFGLEPRDEPVSRQEYVSRIHPDDVDIVHRILTGQEPMSEFELRVRRPDGRQAVLAVSGAPITTRSGRKLIAGTTRDVTGEREAARALASAEERFRRAFEDSGAGMAIIGLDGDRLGAFEDANQAMARLVAMPREKLIGSRWDAVVHPEDADTVATAVRGLVAAERSSFTSEIRLRAGAEQTRWTACSLSLVRDPDGAVLHALLQAQDITERKQVEGQLQFLADHDTLTGLLNRRRFVDEIAREIARVRRYGGESAVLVLDLDRFKPVNDSAGHAVGDQILATVADVLRTRLRATDIVARLGGDEFGVLLPATDRDAAERLATELRAVIAGRMRGSGSPAGARVTASIGVATFAAGDEELAPEELLAHADLAMYAAKQAGRDRVRVHHSDSAAGDAGRTGWVTRIREAIRDDRLTLHAQPIVPIAGGDTRPRYELLLRMLDSDGELITPDRFLYIAERFGLIGKIDRWVINAAAERLAGHQAAGADPVFFVNVAASSLAQPGFADTVAACLEEAGADPRGLVIEMTESEALVNIEQARAFAAELRDLGCGFALDDFGAGFASFYYLKHLDFDFLKIDGEFIDALTAEEADRAVVEALVRVAHQLGKRTIAERVRDGRTVEALRALGVDYGQGNHLGAPAPLPEPQGNALRARA
ncbi:MAG TPA: EAL domain-containing protein [Solirubrobacterales bacterium]